MEDRCASGVAVGVNDTPQRHTSSRAASYMYAHECTSTGLARTRCDERHRHTASLTTLRTSHMYAFSAIYVRVWVHMYGSGSDQVRPSGANNTATPRHI